MTRIAKVSIIGFLLTYLSILGWVEFQPNENITIGIFNATDGSAIIDAVCNISVTQNSVSMFAYDSMLNETGDGYYTWAVSGLVSDAETKNLGKINCSVAGNQWHTGGEFFVVDDYTVNVTDAQPSRVWTEYDNRTVTEIGNSILTDIATAVWNSATRTLTSFGTLVADIWNAIPNIPVWVWNSTEGRNLTSYNQTGIEIQYAHVNSPCPSETLAISWEFNDDFGSPISSIDDIPNCTVWTINDTGGLTQIADPTGALVLENVTDNEFFATVTSTTTGGGILGTLYHVECEGINVTIGGVSHTTRVHNEFQLSRLCNIEDRNVTSNVTATSTTYDNSTINIILPADAI